MKRGTAMTEKTTGARTGAPLPSERLADTDLQDVAGGVLLTGDAIHEMAEIEGGTPWDRLSAGARKWLTEEAPRRGMSVWELCDVYGIARP